MSLPTLKDITVDHKTVLLRVDFNVPLTGDGEVAFDQKIRFHLPTIQYLLSHKAKVVLITHLGKPGFKNDESLRVDCLSKHLEKLLERTVHKLHAVHGASVKKAIDAVQYGEVILLENIRFHEEERTNDAAFAKALASLGDVYVNDSFGTAHRMHASTVGIAKYLPSAAGLLLSKELNELEKLFKKPKKPFTLILGGNKCEVKINVVKNFLEIADNFLIGGGLANTFLYAQGFEVGMSYVEKEHMEEAQELMLTIEAQDDKVMVPEYVKVADKMGDKVPVADLPVEDVEFGMKIFDIGQMTVDKYVKIIERSETIVWNGPMGACEHKLFQKGTEQIARAIAKSKKTTVVGGGETLECLDRLGIPLDSFTHASSGGGAMLEFLQGHKLPAVEALKQKS